MTNYNKIEKSLRSIIKKNPILPVKTDRGILVGDVTIVSDGPLKHIVQKGNKVYADVNLNAAAIAIANLLAKRMGYFEADNIYRADQEYGKWFQDSQWLRARYQQAVDNKDFERADMFWARYCESRDRAIIARNNVQTLAAI